MSDYDPNRMDPNRPDLRQTRYDAARDFNWSWIIGGLAAIAVLIAALSLVGRSGDETAQNPPASTTGQSSPAPKAPPSTPRPNQ